MTPSPSVTWPSAARTTLLSRRTQSTVVLCICGDFRFLCIRRLYPAKRDSANWSGFEVANQFPTTRLPRVIEGQVGEIAGDKRIPQRLSGCGHVRRQFQSYGSFAYSALASFRLFCGMRAQTQKKRMILE